MSDESPALGHDEPEQARPWRPGDGPEPRMTTYPPGHQPALYALVDGRWLWMTVTARADWADGRVAYHGDVSFPDPTDRRYVSPRHRAYWWPQPGRLRLAQQPV